MKLRNKEQAKVPTGVQWKFKTTTAYSGYGDKSAFGYVVYGEKEGHHIFVGVEHLRNSNAFTGEKVNVWSMKTYHIPGERPLRDVAPKVIRDAFGDFHLVDKSYNAKVEILPDGVHFDKIDKLSGLRAMAFKDAMGLCPRRASCPSTPTAASEPAPRSSYTGASRIHCDAHVHENRPHPWRWNTSNHTLRIEQVDLDLPVLFRQDRDPAPESGASRVDNLLGHPPIDLGPVPHRDEHDARGAGEASEVLNLCSGSGRSGHPWQCIRDLRGCPAPLLRLVISPRLPAYRRGSGELLRRS